MNRIKGMVVEILASDTLLIEVSFEGRFNHDDLPDFVKVQFNELSPPYLKGVPEHEAFNTLNNSLLGQKVSANIGAPDADGIYRGKVTCEGSYYRNKKKFI